MASVTSVAQLDGLFKKIYAKKLENLIPDHAKLVKIIPFSKGEQIGDNFNQPVVLTHEHGVTYAAPGSAAFALNTAIAMTTKNAQVPGYQMLIRSSIGYEAAAKSSGSKGAFIRATALVVENMYESMTKRLECSLLYGQKGIGKTADSANASSTQTVVTISDATWAAGIWAGSENAVINFYSGTSQISSGTDGDYTIAAIDVANKTLTVNGSATGITALDVAAAATNTALDIYWKGSYGAETYGIDYLITTSGSIYGINNSTYHLWRGNSYTVGGALTMSKLLKSIATPVAKGLQEKATVIVSPLTYENLNSDLAANRRYDSSYTKEKGTNGFERICYYAQNGELEIMSHPMCKEGEGFIVPTKRLKRIGAQDISFNNPGTGDRFFRELSDNAGFELRAYSNQSLFLERPAITQKLTGIINTTS